MDRAIQPNVTLVETLRTEGIIELLIAIALKLFYDMILFQSGETITKDSPVQSVVLFICGALISTILMIFSRPFMGILIANCFFVVMHMLTILLFIEEADCSVTKNHWMCYVIMTLKGAATVGQYYIYCYVAPVKLAERVYHKQKYFIFGSAIGMCLGGGRIIRVMLLDTFVPVTMLEAGMLAHLFCIILLLLITLILHRHIRNDCSLCRQRRKLNKYMQEQVEYIKRNRTEEEQNTINHKSNQFAGYNA